MVRKNIAGVYRRISVTLLLLMLIFGCYRLIVCKTDNTASELIFFTSLGGDNPPYSDILSVQYDVKTSSISVIDRIEATEYRRMSMSPKISPDGVLVELMENEIHIIRGNDVDSFASGADKDSPVCWLSSTELLYWNEGYTPSWDYEPPSQIVLMKYDLNTKSLSPYIGSDGSKITIPSDCVPVYDMIASDDGNRLYFFIIEDHDWSFYDWDYKIMTLSLDDGSFSKLNPWDQENIKQMSRSDCLIRHPVGMEHDHVRFLLSNQRILWDEQ